MNKLFPYIAVLILGTVIGGWLCRQYHFREVTKVQVDTVKVRDTIEIEKPVVKEVTKTERIYVQVRDTVRMRDTLYMTLQTEKKFYKDAEYYAEVSGYNPSLDYIEVYPKTTTIYKTETKAEKKRNHSLSVGIEANYAYTFSMPIQVEYAYAISQWLSVYGYAEHDLFTRQFGVGVGTQFSIEW